MKRIAWTPEALKELERIESHIARDSPRAAKDVTRRLVKRVQQLAVAPFGAPRLPRYQRDDLRMLFERPYRIVYLVRPEQIEIVTLWHYRQKSPRKIKPY